MFIAKWPTRLAGAVHHSLKSDCGRLPHWHPRLAHGTHPHDFLLEKGRLFALMLLEKGQTLNTIPLERKLDQILLNDRPRAMTWFHLRWVKESHKWFVFLGGMMESPVSLEDLMRRYREVSDFKRGLAYSRCFVHVCSCLSCFSFFVLFVCLLVCSVQVGTMCSMPVHFLGKTDVG